MTNRQPTHFLNALGIINALGSNKTDIADNLFLGKQPGIVKRSGMVPDKTIYVGQVDALLPPIPKRLSNYDCRNNQLLLAAYEQIRDDVENAIACYGKSRVAIVLGSSTSGISSGEQALKALNQFGEMPPEFHYKQQEIGTCAEFFAAYLGLESLAYTITTACSSSAKVFTSAKRLLEQDLCDAVIVGGVDSLCQLTLNGFSALESISNSICNPFSRNRDGITIGEGAALFLMTREPGEIALFGTGGSSDAYHISSPEPQGIGAEAAIHHALVDANLEAKAIDYVNLHGTATLKNDEMESRAVHRVFGDKVACSSTKAQIGHTLGAAGANEVAFCWLALSVYNRNKVLPPQLWDGVVDPELPLLNFAAIGTGLEPIKQHYFLSNSFAFGGSNAAVIIGNVL